MRRLLLVPLAVAVLGGSLEAQRVERTGWVVRQSAQVDLWYHSLAVVGFQGFGAVPLYHPGYAARIRSAKTALGVRPTALDRQATVLLDAFRADSVFEVLHFLPVYFAFASRSDMLDALDAVARDPKVAAREASPRTRFGVGAAGALFTTEAQRQTLATLVSAVRQEWDAFYRDYRADSLLQPAEAHVIATQQWITDSVTTPLQPFLERWHLGHGVVFLSPAVGLDGRFFDGDPEDDRDNIVIAGYTAEPGLEALPVIREWCYPAVRQAQAETTLSGDRVAAEAESGRAAVRCGDLVVERYLTGAAERFRSVFLPGERAVSPADLAARYPLEPGLERALALVVAQ